MTDALANKSLVEDRPFTESDAPASVIYDGGDYRIAVTRRGGANRYAFQVLNGTNFFNRAACHSRTGLMDFLPKLRCVLPIELFQAVNALPFNPNDWLPDMQIVTPDTPPQTPR